MLLAAIIAVAASPTPSPIPFPSFTPPPRVVLDLDERWEVKRPHGWYLLRQTYLFEIPVLGRVPRPLRFRARYLPEIPYRLPSPSPTP